VAVIAAIVIGTIAASSPVGLANPAAPASLSEG